VAADLDPITLDMAQMYRVALNNEAFRADVFAGQRSPVIFGEPPEWIGLMIEALRHTAEGQHAAAQTLRDQAFEMAPPTAGAVDDETFEWIMDADVRLGPVLEAIVNGQYYWIPFQNIRQIAIDAPADLRDVVWMPAQFTWANGGQAVGVIPTRYPGSESSDDPLVRLARKTDWVEADWVEAGDVSLGLGQRLLATDVSDHPLMDIRRITLITGEGDVDVDWAETAPAVEGEGPNG
jgi:type VI secretion system protein ImpE